MLPVGRVAGTLGFDHQSQQKDPSLDHTVAWDATADCPRNERWSREIKYNSAIDKWWTNKKKEHLT